MSDVQGFLESAFGKDSDQDKIEHFEQSTLKLLLRRAGWTKEAIGAEARDLGPAFTFEWFNSQDILPFQVFADRCFNFNIQDLLVNPLKCELIKQYHTRWVEEGREDIAVVFKAFNLGRIVVTRDSQNVLTSSRYLPHVLTLIEPGMLAQVMLWDVFCNHNFDQEEAYDV